jgi:hypothetical protein
VKGSVVELPVLTAVDFGSGKVPPMGGKVGSMTICNGLLKSTSGRGWGQVVTKSTGSSPGPT